MGLEGLKHHNHSTVWVSAGRYVLNRNDVMVNRESIQADYRYLWALDIAIVAHLENNTLLEQEALPVTVKCMNDTGLTFIYVTNITIVGVEFVGCGANQYSTSKVSSEVH